MQNLRLVDSQRQRAVWWIKATLYWSCFRNHSKLSNIRTWTHGTNWKVLWGKVQWFLFHWLRKRNDVFHFFRPQRERGRQKNDSRDLRTGLSGAARCWLKQPELEVELAWSGLVVTDRGLTSEAGRQRFLLLKVNHCRSETQLLLISDWLVVRQVAVLRGEPQPKGALWGDAKKWVSYQLLGFILWLNILPFFSCRVQYMNQLLHFMCICYTVAS